MAKHAVLSASSSERWLNCPPSARLCEGYEDKGSDYAAEGTDAHTLCEYRLKQALGIPAEDPIENLSWYNEEMEECAAGYAAYVVELLETAKQTCSDPVVMIEQRVTSPVGFRRASVQPTASSLPMVSSISWTTSTARV